MKNWKINSWRKYPVKHIPEYPDKKELDQVLGKIKNFPPLVFAGEMKHGPLALIEEGMPVVVLAPRDNYYKKTISNMQEVIARGAKVLLITNKSKDEILSENIWETIEVETTNDDLLPFLLTIPLQKLAYYSALKKGFDIDKPRNLAKSVTVE